MHPLARVYELEWPEKYTNVAVDLKIYLFLNQSNKNISLKKFGSITELECELCEVLPVDRARMVE